MGLLHILKQKKTFCGEWSAPPTKTFWPIFPLFLFLVFSLEDFRHAPFAIKPSPNSELSWNMVDRSNNVRLVGVRSIDRITLRLG